MNGKVSKMLRRMSANDKRTKKIWNSLSPDQKARVSEAYDPNNPNKAIIALMKEMGHVKKDD